MHECYAMQILGTKKTKTNKMQWSQRVEQWSTRTMKARDDQGYRITPIT